VKRSLTPTPEDDEQYENREINYEDERNARRRHRGRVFDLVYSYEKGRIQPKSAYTAT
jgi:hypothetical protein